VTDFDWIVLSIYGVFALAVAYVWMQVEGEE